MNCEIIEVLKNIRTLKSQLEILNELKLMKKDKLVIKQALEKLSIPLFEYLKGESIA